MDGMRVALFGAGRIGSVHAQNLAREARVTDLIIADADPGRAEALAERVGARALGPEAALAANIHAVVIATPTSTHSELVRGFVDRKLPIFCEKPLAETYEATLELVDLLEASAGLLQLGFMRRFDGPHAELRRLIQERSLGTVYAIRIASHDHTGAPEQYIATSGGIFKDLLIHDFDALRWVTGQEVSTVYAEGAIRGFDYVAKYNDVDTTALVLRLMDGVLVSVSAGREDGRGEDNRIEVIGSVDSVALGLGPRTPLRSLEPDAGAPHPEPYIDGFVRYAEAYRAELTHFLSFAAGEAENACGARDGLAAVQIAMAAERSVADKRVVALSELDRGIEGLGQKAAARHAAVIKETAISDPELSQRIEMPKDESVPLITKLSNPIVAAGPVSYGAFEITVGKGFWVPDPKELLDAVASAGYQGVELGPVGYLGSTDELRDRLLERNLQLAGGYIQLPFSEPDRLDRAMPELTALLDTLDAAGPQAKPPKPVLADAGSLLRIQNPGRAAEDQTFGLDRAGWGRFRKGLASVVEICRARGYDPTFHPHAGTFVESAFEIKRLLETSEVGICYDTGHLIIGGADPVTAIKVWGKRINHIHLKDTRLEVIKRLRSEHAISETYYEGEAFSPLGEGNVAIDEVLSEIAELQYSGWLVVEQDVVLKSAKLFSKAVKAQERSRAYLRQRGL